MKNLFNKKKLAGFTICFLSAIFIQATSVNALGNITNRHLELHDNFFEYRSDFNYTYKKEYDNAISFANNNNLTDFIIVPRGPNSVYLYNLLNKSNVDFGSKLSVEFSFRWFNTQFKEFQIYIKNNDFYPTYGSMLINSYVFENDTFSTNENYNNGSTFFITQHTLFPVSSNNDFATNDTLNFPVYCGGTGCEWKMFTEHQPPNYYFESIKYKSNIYNIGDNLDFFGDIGDIVYDINPKDNLKGIYNYSGATQTNLEFIEYNFVVDNLSDNKFTFYLKDPITKIKTKDFESFDLSYRNLNADVNDPFIFIDTFSINDKYSFIKTRNINFDFIEFYFDGAQYREDLYFLNNLLDQVEFKIKIIPKSNIKIQNLHLYDSFNSYNPSLDYYLIPKTWKVNNKNHSFDYFTTGFIQGVVSELDNLKEINLPPGVNKIFLYSNTDTLSTVIGYDLTDKRRLYNYSLSEQNIISTVSNYEILDSFNTKWQNLYKIEKNIYNNEIFYLELLDFHSLGYTLWVSQNVEYKYFIDKAINIKDVPIDNVSNPDRQEIIDIDNSFSYFKKGFNAVNILYGIFYNNLTTEFKFLHNFLITLMILSVVLWVVML